MDRDFLLIASSISGLYPDPVMLVAPCIEVLQFCVVRRESPVTIGVNIEGTHVGKGGRACFESDHLMCVWIRGLQLTTSLS